MRVRAFAGLDELPAEYVQLLDVGGSRVVFYRPAWIRALAANLIGPGDALVLLGIEAGKAEPKALMAARLTLSSRPHPRARLLAFVQADAAPLVPLAAEGVDAADVYAAVARYARQVRPAYDVLRFQPMEPGSEHHVKLLRALRKAGYLTQTFKIFANRHQDVRGLSSTQYFDGLPSRLRNTLQRKGRRLARTGKLRYALGSGGSELDAMIGDYDRVIAASWKQGEQLLPVEYLHAIMRAAADAGALRMGLLYFDEEPAAAQFWVISDGVAYLYRTAYQTRFHEWSAGTLLTWRVIEHLLDVDHIRELDLGIGDDAYKKDWASSERDRCGVLACNPATYHGLRNALRHIVGHAMKGLLLKLRALSPRS